MFEHYQLFRRNGVGGVFYEAIKGGNTAGTITAGMMPNGQQTVIASGLGVCSLHSTYDFSETIVPGARRIITECSPHEPEKTVSVMIWRGGPVHLLQIESEVEITVTDKGGAAIFTREDREIATVRNANPAPVGSFPLSEHYYETAKKLDVAIDTALSDVVQGLILAFPMLKLGSNLNQRSSHSITANGQQIQDSDCYYFDQYGEPCDAGHAAHCVIREYDRNGELIREAWESLTPGKCLNLWEQIKTLFHSS